MEQAIIYFIGWMILFSACDYKRKEESKIKAWTKESLIQSLLILLGFLLLTYDKN